MTGTREGRSVAYFAYGDGETDYLKTRDARLGEAIDQIGHVWRVVDDDLFSSVVHHIVGQQVSTKAQETIWRRMGDILGEVTPQTIAGSSIEELQAFGTTFRKAEYLWDFSQRVVGGAFDIEAVRRMSDRDAIAALTQVKGIGQWTAEMILLFCLQRPDVLSFDDLAIQRGMRMLYHHRKITRQLFERYRRRYSPHGSVASLYLWAIAGGALPGMRDYAPKSVRKKR